ncbi:YkuS family protein [Hathewaya histolytica]|uniref:Uncharacterized protein family (UPF0180) n=1 Tax=Hathewaya histolytica TaxID=1498 RepID=A0A4V6KH73_HATHI|nr:YkuS family protein [Hathewaya histolytica]VTQ96587.1 Uncharacterized protein family (UPF0180) [Hathewaya histolytica]
MKICVWNELKELRNGLYNKGYVVIDENVSEPCDAIICDLKNSSLANIVKLDNNIKKEGTIIIDGRSKSIEDIENILTTKYYSQIF